MSSIVAYLKYLKYPAYCRLERKNVQGDLSEGGKSPTGKCPDAHPSMSVKRALHRRHERVDKGLMFHQWRPVVVTVQSATTTTTTTQLHRASTRDDNRRRGVISAHVDRDANKL